MSLFSAKEYNRGRPWDHVITVEIKTREISGTHSGNYGVCQFFSRLYFLFKMGCDSFSVDNSMWIWVFHFLCRALNLWVFLASWQFVPREFSAYKWYQNVLIPWICRDAGKGESSIQGEKSTTGESDKKIKVVLLTPLIQLSTTNYRHWAMRMEVHLDAQWFWEVVAIMETNRQKDRLALSTILAAIP